MRKSRKAFANSRWRHSEAAVPQAWAEARVGPPERACVDSAQKHGLARSIMANQSYSVLSIGLIILAMIILPWLFRKFFL